MSSVYERAERFSFTIRENKVGENYHIEKEAVKQGIASMTLVYKADDLCNIPQLLLYSDVPCMGFYPQRYAEKREEIQNSQGRCKMY